VEKILLHILKLLQDYLNKRRAYTVDSIPINTNGQAVESNCAEIMIANYGTTTLIINNSITVPPPAAGQVNAITIAGNVGEIDRTKYQCRFAGAGINNAVIIRRNYK
jgi:hypothetical protein